MSDEDESHQLESQQQPSRVSNGYIEGPAFLGAWLNQTQSSTGKKRLEWQQSCSNLSQHKLHEAASARKIYNATVEEDVRAEDQPLFSLSALYSTARYIDNRHFDAFVPHDALLSATLEDVHHLQTGHTLPGSSVCADWGVVPIGSHATNRFYVVGAVTGRRANEFSALLPQDFLTRSRNWTSAPIPEKHHVVMSFPTPIRDVKVCTNSSGTSFGIRTDSVVTLLSFSRHDEATPGSGDIGDFAWQAPVNLGRDHFRGLAISDFAHDPYFSDGRRGMFVFVDETGGLWRSRSPTVLVEEVTNLPYASPYSPVEQLRLGSMGDGRSAFAKIMYGKDHHTAIIAREDAVRVFNMKNPRHDYTLFTITDTKTRILNVAQPARSNPSCSIRVICTTTEVIWLDLDKPGLPSLRHKHYRDQDDTLSLTSAFCDGLYHTFLWSRKTALMTVYTHPAEGPVHLIVPPYDIPPPIPNICRSGVTYVHLSSKQRKRWLAPEALVLIESAIDGSIYQRELISQERPASIPETDGVRVQHKRLNAEQPLASLKPEDTRKTRDTKFFMLYNTLFSSQRSLHREPIDSSGLEAITGANMRNTMQVPLEMVKPSLFTHASTVESVKAEIGGFSSALAVDATNVNSENIDNELEELSLASQADFSFQFSDDVLGITRGNEESQSVSAALSASLQDMYARDRYRRNKAGVRGAHHQSTSTELAHRYACDQAVVDLALSRDVHSAETPMYPMPGAKNKLMTDYERLSDMPNFEYGFFRPATDMAITSDATRALLSEWKLGADPASRPAYQNPYSQQVQDERVSNKQLNAFKTRIAQGVGISASQPAAAFHHESQTLPRAVPSTSLRNRDPIVIQASQPTAIRETTIPPMSQPLLSTPLPQSESETQMPFTQMEPGAHGGRPAKKKKKRAGGF